VADDAPRPPSAARRRVRSPRRLAGYDALYVAAAIAVPGKIITADGPLARAPLDLTIHNVREG